MKRKKIGLRVSVLMRVYVCDRWMVLSVEYKTCVHIFFRSLIFKSTFVGFVDDVSCVNGYRLWVLGMCINVVSFFVIRIVCSMNPKWNLLSQKKTWLDFFILYFSPSPSSSYLCLCSSIHFLLSHLSRCCAKWARFAWWWRKRTFFFSFVFVTISFDDYEFNFTSQNTLPKIHLKIKTMQWKIKKHTKWNEIRQIKNDEKYKKTHKQKRKQI